MARDSRDVEVDRSVEEDKDDFKWPEISELRPAQAGKLYDQLDAAAREANRQAKIAAKRKAKAKYIAMQVMEDYEEKATRFSGPDGRDIQLTEYDFKVFYVANEETFRAWAETQDEEYYDKTPKLREDIVRDEARRRFDDGEPLPPGVDIYLETRLSRTAVK